MLPVILMAIVVKQFTFHLLKPSGKVVEFQTKKCTVTVFLKEWYFDTLNKIFLLPFSIFSPKFVKHCPLMKKEVLKPCLKQLKSAERLLMFLYVMFIFL